MWVSEQDMDKKSLESVVEGTRNNVVLLLFGKGVELNSVTRNANGQLRILLWVCLSIKKSVLSKNVNVEVMTALLGIAINHVYQVVNLLGSYFVGLHVFLLTSLLTRRNV
jgi:hypothetical protein